MMNRTRPAKKKTPSHNWAGKVITVTMHAVAWNHEGKVHEIISIDHSEYKAFSLIITNRLFLDCLIRSNALVMP